MESGKKHIRDRKKTWRADLKDAAKAAFDYQGEALWPSEPLSVHFVFVRARTGGHLRSGRHEGTVKEWAFDRRPVTRPDALKLARAAEDALTGILWHDDAQIVEEHLDKVFGDQVGLDPKAEGLLLIATVARPYHGPQVVERVQYSTLSSYTA
jgi:Holliday junction resolvase RusA-like endonuclease